MTAEWEKDSLSHTCSGCFIFLEFLSTFFFFASPQVCLAHDTSSPCLSARFPSLSHQCSHPAWVVLLPHLICSPPCCSMWVGEAEERGSTSYMRRNTAGSLRQPQGEAPCWLLAASGVGDVAACSSPWMVQMGKAADRRTA